MRTLLDAIDAVIAGVQAQAAAAPVDERLAGLQVTFGPPTGRLEVEGVVVGETIEDAEREQTSLGPPGMFASDDERYSVAVQIEVYKPGGSQREAAVRADRIVDLVDAACAALTENPPQWLLSAYLRRGALRNVPAAEGRSSIYRCDVDVHARI